MRAQFVGDGGGGYVMGGGYQVAQAETGGPGQGQRAPFCSRCQLLQLLRRHFAAAVRRFAAASSFCCRSRCQFRRLEAGGAANFAAGATGGGRCSSSDSCY